MPAGIVIPMKHMLEHKTYFAYQNTRNKNLKIKSTDISYYLVGSTGNPCFTYSCKLFTCGSDEDNRNMEVHFTQQ
jgi:hypothetical protein